ncbi:sprD domain protein [Tamlana haliotis]|uniref:SprD domain protein n=1 Tax=Pseudotamlana haliotis TaxID=2614804 RepID=A0A6N6MI64_9FLAO|nr:sprD domain protein [Tamlana haliotis]
MAEEKRLQEEIAASALAESERLRKEEEARLAEENRLKQEQEAAALAEAARLKAEKEEALKAIAPKDEATKQMNDVARSLHESSKEQEELIDKLKEKVAIKQQDLDDLIEENNLSEQGIVKAPKAFKSISAENRELEELTNEIDNIVAAQNNKIRRLDRIYKERLSEVSDPNDATNKFYKRRIEELKSQQVEVLQIRQGSIFKIQELKEEIKEERKRRIKRALYDNDEERYQKDRAALNVIRQNTPVSSQPLTADDFDYGEELSNIQIVKGIKHVEEGYYLVVAVHTDTDKRDEFLRKAVASGQKDINFFFDVNTSKYYIYYEHYDGMSNAQNALGSKGNKPFNSKMSIVKIEK